MSIATTRRIFFVGYAHGSNRIPLMHLSGTGEREGSCEKCHLHVPMVPMSNRLPISSWLDHPLWGGGTPTSEELALRPYCPILTLAACVPCAAVSGWACSKNSRYLSVIR